MNFSNIRQNLENIDYAWNKPQTYLVFVPGISIMLQKIQLANILPLIDNPTDQNMREADTKSRKFANICKWHLRGSMIQIIACMIAIKIFAIPLFLLLGILATYELGDTLIRSLRSITFYKFYDNGTVSTIESSSACNIF